MQETAAIILAAGISSRMKTGIPKVLHRVCGRAMLDYVLDACRQAGVNRIYVVVGRGAEQVKDRYKDASDIVWVYQDQQKGTAHAVMCCRDHLQDFQGSTMVLCGDGPLIQGRTLCELIQNREKDNAAASLATAVLEDPTGYGRIVRDDNGAIKAIIEHNDCISEQLAIHEVNPSYYIFDNQQLFGMLEKVGSDNAKNEYYLTDIIPLMLQASLTVTAVNALSPEEALSVNSRDQLSFVGRVMQKRIQKELIDSGVTIVDPDNTWLEAGVKIGRDSCIEPFTYISGLTEIGRNCRIGPLVYLEGENKIEDGREVKPESCNRK